MSAGPMLSVDRLASAERTRRLSIGLVVLCASLVLGGAAGALALSGHALLIVMLAGLAFPVVIWNRPDIGIGLIVLLAALIEQYPIDQSPMSALPAMIVTDQIPLFISFNGSLGLSGLMVSPLEIAIFATLIIWIMKGIVQRSLHLPRSRLAFGIGCLAGLVVIGEILGLAHGGNFRESIDELRPWFYLTVLYLLASQLLDLPGGWRPILWGFVIGTGIKGVQGTIRFMLVRSAAPRPDSILAHEEALFFALFILLVVALWLFGQKGRLRTVATALLPAVLLADLGNNRRAAWLILLAGLMALGAIAWVRLPDRRPLVRRLAIAAALLGSVYLAIFWNSTGSLAQPARALRSAIAPSNRDNLSDLYRNQENANLAFNIKLAGPLGAGFGTRIDYALPITDLTKTSPSLAYVPHDGILYVWMRLGVAGILTFWFVIGAAMVAACRLIRSPNPQLALFGSVLVCVVIAYVLEGYYDLGLSWYRVAVFVGCMLGALEAARPAWRLQ